MSNRFYVYREHYDAVYEPAEGGYYVEETYIDWVQDEFDGVAAVETFLEEYCNAVNGGAVALEAADIVGIHTDEHGNLVPDEVTPKIAGEYIYFDEQDYYLHTPHVHFDTSHYIGDGWGLGISMNEPQDEPYGGYC